ncbi:Aquaporin NIP3-1 (NOD26-like intrinsic protein 3-1) (AtNIP3 [Durusdinium trenchii]|uniref:Aquaporin NIP3-1 (NOD26-like intrinsic protein 3-1) (AtNIP3) n=2 Tax=Durusdinium trenchii TaxID=1381693 RepID=A0ABP0HRR2_9DINO
MATFQSYPSLLSQQFAQSLVMEFMGVMLFQLLGGSAAAGWGAPVNGMALVVLIYTTADISGAHLNPAVSISLSMAGFFPVLHCIMYVLFQIVGAIFGALILSQLVPGMSIGMGDGGAGCFDRGMIPSNVTDAQIFWWEFFMTFTLISCVYNCCLGKPGHGSFTPLAVGLALFASAGSGGQFTGGSLNPARVLGPAAVFGCGANVTWLYVGGQCLASICAMAVFGLVSHLGPYHPRTSTKTFELMTNEAGFVWINGQAPLRLQTIGQDQDLKSFSQRQRDI